MPNEPNPRPVWTPARLAGALGLLAGLAVVLTLGDPGLTVDEPLDVRPGRKYVATLKTRGLNFFDRSVVDSVFADNAEHPPLGRWLLGIASTFGQPFEMALLGSDPLNLYTLSARLAPASAFALLVGMVVWTAAWRYGTVAGVSTGFALAVMPRVFAHAHLGALDTFISAFWTVGLLAADRALTSRRPAAGMAAAGVVWGLALLTKIHAWFLIPVVLVWSFVRLSRPGQRLALPVGAFLAWAAVGLSLFFVGWPWLWYDPTSRFLAYLGTGIARASIRVLYFGTVYADVDVPWHYPWVYFAATVPVGLHALGLVGLARGLRDRKADSFPVLLAGSIVLFLAVFSTRVPVYDGERLFLMTFPLWAVLIGMGCDAVWRAAGTRVWLRTLLVVVLVGQSHGVVTMHPFGLSYYNALVGGLRGAETLGMELTYWGDAVDRVLLDRLVKELPAGETAALVPTLYPGQGISTTTRLMASHSNLMSDEDIALRAPWVVVSRREAYWGPEFRARLANGRAVVRRSRQGVWLSSLYALPVPPPRSRTRGTPPR